MPSRQTKIATEKAESLKEFQTALTLAQLKARRKGKTTLLWGLDPYIEAGKVEVLIGSGESAKRLRT